MRLNEAQKQLAKANGQLAAYKPFINAEYQAKLALELKVSTRTIETYMAGKGKRLHFAVELLEKVRDIKADISKAAA